MEKENIFSKETLPPEEKREKKDLWQEKKESILKGLEEKVGIIKEIKTLIDDTKIDDDLEIVSQKFENYQEQIFDRYPQVYEILKEREEFRNELNTLNKRLFKVLKKEQPSEKLSPEEKEELNNLKSKRNELEQKLEGEIPKDVEFLASIENGINLLIYKFFIVQKSKNNQEFLKEELNTIILPGLVNEKTGEIGYIDQDKIKEIIFRPFSITLVLEEEYFRSLLKTDYTSGVHISESVFCIICDQKDKDLLSETIEHENIHNFLEGFLPPSVNFLEKFQKVFKRIESLRKLKAPSPLIEDEKRIFRIPAFRIIDGLHSEILADIYRVERLDQKNKLKQSIWSIRGITGFTTAKSMIFEIKQLLNKVKKKETDLEIVNFCTQIVNEIDKTFARVTTFMRKALFVCRYTKDVLEIHSLLCLLKPSQFHHLENYLRYRYGNGWYDRISVLYKYLIDKNLSLETVRGLTNIKNEIPESDVGLLKQQLESIKDFALFVEETKLEDCSLEELREYFAAIESLNSRLKIKNEKITEFKEGIMWNFFFSFFCKSLKNNFETLSEVIDKLTSQEKKVFEEVLEDYFGDEFIYEDLRDIYGEQTYNDLYEKTGYEFVKSLPLWQVLEKLDLSHIAQRGILRCKERKEREEKNKITKNVMKNKEKRI